MSIINSKGWRFSFDKQATKQYYEELNDLCQCDMCRNFYLNVDKIPVDLRIFLEQFGIDVAKPIEQWSLTANKENRRVDNTIYYAVNGYATSPDEDEIEIGAVTVFVESPKPDDVVKCPEYTPNTEIPEPYFILIISNLWLPWTINSDIDECYPDKKPLFRRILGGLNR